MSLARNIFTTLAARLFLLLVALGSSIALARLLGPEGRGLFALVLLLPGLARSFGTLGLDEANTVYAGLEPRARGTLIWHSGIVATFFGGAITIGAVLYILLGAGGSGTLLRGPLWLYVLPLSIVPAALAADYWGAIARGMNRITLINMLQVGTKVAAVAFTLTFVWGLGLGVAGAVWADVIVNLGAVVAVGVVLYTTRVWGRPSFDWSLWKRTVRFAIPAYISTFMSYLNYRVDQFIVAVFLPAEQLAYYVIAVGLAERLWILAGSVGTPLLPHLTNTPDRDPALSAIVARHVLVWTGGLALFVFALSDFIVRGLYSSAYEAAVAPLRWLLVGIVTLSVGRVLIGELLARTRNMFTIWVSIVTAATNIAGNLVLIPRLGISGAAIASTVSYTLLSLIVVAYYLRETGVPWTVLIPRLADVRVYGALGRRIIPLGVRRSVAPGRVSS